MHRIGDTRLPSPLAIVKGSPPQAKVWFVAVETIFVVCVYKYFSLGCGNGMWGFHRSREWGQGGFFSFFCFCFEGEHLLSEETERNFVSCPNRDHSQKWQATAQWRQGQILNGCIHSRGGK